MNYLPQFFKELFKRKEKSFPQFELSSEAKNILDDGVFRRSFAHINLNTFGNIKELILRKRNLKIAFLGGSISGGASASKKENRFSTLLIKKMHKTYPNTTFSEINAAQGGTGSYLGIFRLEKDVIKYKPDLVILEFSVNDGESLHEKIAYENIIRTLQSHNILVIVLFLNTNIGTTRQYWQQIVSKHYDVSAVSFYNAIYPLVNTGVLKWEKIWGDNIHFNDIGHEIISTILFNFIQTGLYEFVNYKPVAKPSILYGADFMQNFVYQFGSDVGSIIHNLGFRELEVPPQNFFCGNGFITEKVGSELSFEFMGTSLGLVYRTANDPSFGCAEIQVDDYMPITLNGYDNTLQNNRPIKPTLIQMKLSDGKHIVKIKTKNNDTEKSDTSIFEIHSFLIGRGTFNLPSTPMP